MDSERSLGYLDAYEDGVFLSPCFIETICYEKALSPATNYICGRRGTGKSAIVLRLMSDKRFKYHDEVKGHEFYQQLLIELKSQNAAEINKRFFFQRVWKHLILVAAMNAIVKDMKDTDFAGQLSPIYEYLKANRYFNKRPLTLWQKIIASTSSFIRKYRGKSDLSNMVLTYLTELLESNQFIDAEAALKAHLSKESKCLVVVDTIMDQFERDEVFVACVEGLLMAVLELTCKKYSEFLQIKCCIPGELYNHIHLYEQSKIRDHVVELTWKPKDLIRLLSKRYYYYLLLSKQITQLEFDGISWKSYNCVKEKVWDKYIPKNITNGRNIDEPTHVYIMRHSQHTPRELISIFNNIMSENEINERKGFSRSIITGIHETIGNTVRELIISNQFLIPNLEQIMDVSFSGKTKIMSAGEIRKALGHSKSFWKVDAGDPFTEDILVKHLISIGFLGVVVGEDIENKHVIKCKFSYMAPDALSMGRDTQYAIHPIFYDRFNILPVAGKVVYPIRQYADRWDEVF
ncbi:P-loop ATPase, Sll1717 family [Geomonas azotofigens]|uniref:P-loop ATPase, Sll1717 family n=1 Tax=Geomonas azotofigens TaxID=2843196 RepID=UPI001C0F43AE|nr:hypothetical protein [Geomonas azotofigens]MBU5612659.1 hypothetical protein [Geomonas azotofigens]